MHVENLPESRRRIQTERHAALHVEDALRRTSRLRSSHNSVSRRATIPPTNDGGNGTKGRGPNRVRARSGPVAAGGLAQGHRSGRLRASNMAQMDS